MEEAGSGTFKVFMPSEVGDKLLLGKYPCLRESVHSFVYREQDAVVTDARMKVVFGKYFLEMRLSGMRRYSNRSVGVLK